MKAQAEPLVVRTSQWINALQIDVVADDYKPPLRELAFDAPGRVRQDHRLHSHSRENTNGKHHVFCRISLIEMDAALHPRNGHRSHFPNDQLPRVPNGCRPRKIRDLSVRNSRCAGEFVGKRTQPRTENQRDLRTELGSGTNEIRSEPGALEFSGKHGRFFGKSGRPLGRVSSLLRFQPGFLRAHVNIPTMEADIRLAIVPASIARIPNLASCPRCSGASAPIPPI